ncbi:unnamed protein product [Ilex paraguariensis]|uniref:Uncharacterized protein n=1 Tax=Ilex paraguariensis TaxID=185542 RepID=A0ABC8RUU7_9AQUA
MKFDRKAFSSMEDAHRQIPRPPLISRLMRKPLKWAGSRFQLGPTGTQCTASPREQAKKTNSMSLIHIIHGLLLSYTLSPLKGIRIPYGRSTNKIMIQNWLQSIVLSRNSSNRSAFNGSG